MKKIIFFLMMSITMVSCGVSKKEYEASVASNNQRIEQLKKQNLDLNEKVLSQAKEIETLNGKINTLKEEHEKELEQISQSSSAKPFGVYYVIQIGAIKNAASGSDDNQFLTKEGEYYKWRIGYFNTLKEVELAKKDLKSLGIKQFWVIPMKDGKRITFEQAKSESKI